ncbi:preprotein translocase subunit SecG [Candidatus Saccharibacteria bacterium]|jgi:preprotein translocase subunit SecG|nr:preprotein translocase subunit SecG [Candidatus Saccharibacteria bacterium]
MTSDILQWTMLISAALLILTILMQQRGASLGAGFGGSSELYTTRRGFDKNLFESSIIFTVIFVLSILAGILLPS